MYQYAICINMQYVSICNMYQYAICINMQYVSICNMYQYAICINMQYVSICNMYQYAICINMQYVSICNMYQYAICINMQYVSICNMYQYVSCKQNAIHNLWRQAGINLHEKLSLCLHVQTMTDMYRHDNDQTVSLRTIKVFKEGAYRPKVFDDTLACTWGDPCCKNTLVYKCFHTCTCKCMAPEFYMKDYLIELVWLIMKSLFAKRLTSTLANFENKVTFLRIYGQLLSADGSKSISIKSACKSFCK